MPGPSMLAQYCQCWHYACMSVQITIRDVPEKVRDELAARAELHSFHAVSERVWELRHNVSIYDGWYVALAEALDVPLATLDERLVEAEGPQCRFLTPAPDK